MKTLISILPFLLICTVALGQSTTRVSVASDGTEGDDDSYARDIDLQGRFVLFESHATNLVPDDTNGVMDIFVYDRMNGETERVSLAYDGSEPNDTSHTSRISSDGRYITFRSGATNLVTGDTNGYGDVFVRGLETNQIKIASVATDGTQGNDSSHEPSLSADGRIVGFMSWATNLVPGDTNGHDDVFVHDRVTGETSRVSVATDGTQGNDHSERPHLSANGRWVVFHTHSTNLDEHGMGGVFVHDRLTGATTRASVAHDGTPATGNSPHISEDGRYVVFSGGDGLVPGDTNGFTDVFVRDLVARETRRVSVATDGTQGNHWSDDGAISPDGGHVAFYSGASTLVPNDTNGTGDIFVHKLLTSETRRVSLSSTGEEGNGYSAILLTPVPVSWGADVVSYWSDASNLVPGDTNGIRDVFVHALALFRDGFESGDTSAWSSTVP